jgi:hypothetical protein
MGVEMSHPLRGRRVVLRAGAPEVGGRLPMRQYVEAHVAGEVSRLKDWLQHELGKPATLKNIALDRYWAEVALRDRFLERVEQDGLPDDGAVVILNDGAFEHIAHDTEIAYLTLPPVGWSALDAAIERVDREDEGPVAPAREHTRDVWMGARFDGTPSVNDHRAILDIAADVRSLKAAYAVAAETLARELASSPTSSGGEATRVVQVPLTARVPVSDGATATALVAMVVAAPAGPVVWARDIEFTRACTHTAERLLEVNDYLPLDRRFALRRQAEIDDAHVDMIVAAYERLVGDALAEGRK